jgi:hypothetical protein
MADPRSCRQATQSYSGNAYYILGNLYKPAMLLLRQMEHASAGRHTAPTERVRLTMGRRVVTSVHSSAACVCVLEHAGGLY